MAGNMVDYDGVSRTYNAANQMTNDGTNTLTYDNNGNLTGNGTDTYVWDRANRLLSVGNHSYVYDGLGNRVQQTVSSVVTDYLNDVQPGLTKLLKQTTGATVQQFVHAPRGIHAVDDGTDWNFYAQDGLGSVRALIADSAVVQSSMSFDPYGNPMAAYGAGFGFTGEQTDEDGSVFLRARYYEPDLGIFTALDPMETPNRYAYVSGNPINRVDPTGLQDVVDGVVILDEIWERAIEAAFRNAQTYQTADDFAFAVADDIARQTGGLVTDDLLLASVQRVSTPAMSLRLNAVGIIVSANVVTIRGDYAGTAYDFALGTATNMTRFENVLSPLERLGIISDGTQCLVGIPQMSASPQNQRDNSPVAYPQPESQSLLTNQEIATATRTRDENAPCGWSYPNKLPYIPFTNEEKDLFVFRNHPAEFASIIFQRTERIFIYVVTLAGQFIVGNEDAALTSRNITMNHPSLVDGMPVAYAGQANFNANGTQLTKWDRRSGHYQPNPDGDRAESECIRRVIASATGWNFQSVPPESDLNITW